MLPNVISVRDAATLSSLSVPMIYKLIREKKITVYQNPTRRILVDRRSLIEYLNLPDDRILETRVTR